MNPNPIEQPAVWVSFALVVVAVASLGRHPAPRAPQPGMPAMQALPGALSIATTEGSSVLRSRELRFVPLADGREAVLEAPSGGLVYMLPADKNQDSFLRVTIRILKRNRGLRGADPTAPFRLMIDRQQGLVLQDDLSDSRLPVRAFGTSAVASLSPLMVAPAVPLDVLPPVCPRPEC